MLVTAMIGFQNRKGQDLQKPFPGFVGRMFDIFDLSSGMPRTKLLTDKPHRDGSPTSRNRTDIVKKKPIDTVRAEDNSILDDLRKSSVKKSSGTPMKMLIAQEMLRDAGSNQKPSNVVARLMGLDALPVQKSDPTPKRSLLEGYARNVSNHEKGYKDVYEAWHQPPLKGRIDENLTEKRMTLVRQKFTEAKRLATDERLHSKEFQDALDVLSSNGDMFLKFLEEPNSLFSKYFCGIQSVVPPPSKLITVLKPSKTIEVKGGAGVVKSINPTVFNIDDHCMNTNQTNLRSSTSVHNKTENISQSTRIVVLKPSHGMPDETKITNEAVESTEAAKEITREMRQCLGIHLRDEALLSSSALSNGYVGDASALSNAYVGDASSFNRSENDSNEEVRCNASDSEDVTPTSRHSWDYINSFSSPYSNSSFSHAYHSSEPPVIKEAKKRLSERLAMVASNSMYQEKTHMQRSLSTLGEMLSIFPDNKGEASDSLSISSRRSCSGEQGPKTSVGCFSTVGMKENTPKSLPRSKSLPSSSYSVFENIKMNEVVPNIMPKEAVAKSFKEKVSSFFSRSRKSGQENRIPSRAIGSDDRCLFKNTGDSCKRKDASSESFHDGNSESGMSANSEKYGGASSITTSHSDGEKHATPSVKSSLFSDKRRASEFSRENQDLPSPISVLEASFGDDCKSISRPSAVSGNPQALSRSPPIGSISRTLTRDNSSIISKILSNESEEKERFTFVHKLLSSSSLIDSGECSTMSRWYSLDSPLDPSLLDEFLDKKGEGAKFKERRSNQRLLFDCVNAALTDIAHRSYTNVRTHGRVRTDGVESSLLAEEVWRAVSDLFLSEDCRNRDAVVEGLVKREMAGTGWAESMRWEIELFGEEIGREMLEELVKEALAELTCVCL